MHAQAGHRPVPPRAAPARSLHAPPPPASTAAAASPRIHPTTGPARASARCDEHAGDEHHRALPVLRRPQPPAPHSGPLAPAAAPAPPLRLLLRRAGSPRRHRPLRPRRPRCTSSRRATTPRRSPPPPPSRCPPRPRSPPACSPSRRPSRSPSRSRSRRSPLPLVPARRVRRPALYALYAGLRESADRVLGFFVFCRGALDALVACARGWVGRSEGS